MDLAFLAVVGLGALYVIAKLIIILAPVVLTSCVAGGCWATAWGMGTSLPFDDLALLLTTIQMLAASAFTVWAFKSFHRALIDLRIVSDEPKGRKRK